MRVVIEPPIKEPPGFASVCGFVKSHPENNAHYLKQYEEWDWYPIILWLNRELEELIPGYNIRQIKSKFGGLRFYFSYPDEIPVKPEWPAYDTEAKIKSHCEAKVLYAEGWVAGFEAAKENLSN